MSNRGKLAAAIIGAVFLASLYLISLRNYLLFHGIAEAFSIVIAFCIFILAWNTRRLMENSYLLFIGIAYLFIGGIDFLHTLAYTGMGVFPEHSTDLATQLWLAARYMESLSLLIAPLLLGRRLRLELPLVGYVAASSLLVLCIFYCGLFPTCFIEGEGLTMFKKVSEYVISLILLASVVGLLRKRNYFETGILRLIIASIFLTIASELAFTFYIHAYGFSNLIGHFLKIISFYLIYKAIIETGLRRPYDLLFRELKQRERALRESAQAYRAIFENTGTATLIIEEDTTISLVNTEFENLSGYAREEVEGKMSWRDFVRPEDRATLAGYHEGRREGDEEVPKSYDFKIVNRSGEERDVHMMVSMMPGTSRSVASAMDITERKRAEEIIRRDKETLGRLVKQKTDELLDAYRKLAESKRLSSIGTLAATVAHELRNPLGVIHTAILNIRRKSKEPALDKHLNNVEGKVWESDRIISNLLRYSNIRPPEQEEADLHAIITECMSSTAGRFPGQEIEVTSDLDDLRARPAEVDAVQIKEVFDNILNNAYQAVAHKRGHITVRASHPENGDIMIVVRDDGAGISEDDLEMVFEPFFTTRTRGTGLGLAICRELVRLHGGDIRIESRPGAGTTVTVTLPAGRSEPAGH